MPGRATPTRILLVDDHALIRQGLAGILSDAFEHAHISEAGTASQALEMVRREAWDIVLLDVSLPGRSGLELLKDLRQERHALRVLMISMHPEHEFGLRAFRAGASGYFTKSSPNEKLIEAVRKVLAGGKYVTPEFAEILATDVQADASRPPHELLSDREYQVMTLLASGKTVSQVAAELQLSVPTVSTYRARILEKMQLENNAQLTQYALRNHLID